MCTVFPAHVSHMNLRLLIMLGEEYNAYSPRYVALSIILNSNLS